jgi:hypothetical protein
MKQIFEIETKSGIMGLELLSCLEDTIGDEEILSVREIKK